MFEPYVENRTLGGFILIDKITNATVAAGMLHFSLPPGVTSQPPTLEPQLFDSHLSVAKTWRR